MEILNDLIPLIALAIAIAIAITPALLLAAIYSCHWIQCGGPSYKRFCEVLALLTPSNNHQQPRTRKTNPPTPP